MSDNPAALDRASTGLTAIDAEMRGVASIAADDAGRDRALRREAAGYADDLRENDMDRVNYSKALPAAALVAACFAVTPLPVSGQTQTLQAPRFHHLGLNTVDPDAAIAFYTRQFPSTSRSTWGGFPALKSPNDVMLLFNKVDIAPPLLPQTAIWHFGWHVVDERKNLAAYKGRSEVKLRPLFTSAEGGSVLVSSDTWPGTGGVLGLTAAQIVAARAAGTRPVGGAGFAYLEGPDGALIEYQGNFPAERFNHVHMYQEDPFCAQLWYRDHLGASVVENRAAGVPRSAADCKVARGADRTWSALEPQGMFRTPGAAVTFGDVALTWYMRQGDRPLASTRGHVYDHIGLSVTDLDAWVAKLRREGVAVIEEPHSLGDTRAAMIEGPSREAIELVEAK
jgi:catechol 2,3-dioxygenase-like lactoylglutathione lyase family enzyme